MLARCGCRKLKGAQGKTGQALGRESQQGLETNNSYLSQKTSWDENNWSPREYSRKVSKLLASSYRPLGKQLWPVGFCQVDFFFFFPNSFLKANGLYWVLASPWQSQTYSSPGEGGIYAEGKACRVANWWQKSKVQREEDRGTPWYRWSLQF